MNHSNVAFIIPSRIGSTRLQKKALAKIGEYSMIENVVMQLQSLGENLNLYVATDSHEISQKAEAIGATSIMTSENCKTGSDRVYEAFSKIPTKDKIDYIVNVQGDMPFIDSTVLEMIINKLQTSEFDIVTAAVKVGINIAKNESNVKIVKDKNDKALYFSRSVIPHGANEFLYHVGIYGFHANSLKKFVELPETNYEITEKLEQLRALENGMNIGIVMSDEIPISVDTPEDLEKAREHHEQNHHKH